MTMNQNPMIDEVAEAELDINYEEAIEAILFAAGHPVTYDKLALALELSPSKVKDMVASYAKRYNGSKLPRGVMLIVFDDSCQLCTKEEYISYIRTALGIRKSGTLSASSIETLAIIAYHQPVTRVFVDAVRGVDSSYAVTNLLERDLICVRGRMDAPGRPMLYGTTEGFLRCFGLNSLSQLPGIENEEISQLFTAIDEKLGDHDDDGQMSIDDMLPPAEGAETTADPVDTTVIKDAEDVTEEPDVTPITDLMPEENGKDE